MTRIMKFKGKHVGLFTILHNKLLTSISSLHMHISTWLNFSYCHFTISFLQCDWLAICKALYSFQIH